MVRQTQSIIMGHAKEELMEIAFFDIKHCFFRNLKKLPRDKQQKAKRFIATFLVGMMITPRLHRLVVGETDKQAQAS